MHKAAIFIVTPARQKSNSEFFCFNFALLSVIVGLFWMTQVLISTSSIVWILSVCFKVLLQASNLYIIAAFGPDARPLILFVPNEHKYPTFTGLN
jgi:hypothetical protein